MKRVDDITAKVAARFRTFGGGRTAGQDFNPLISMLKDQPAMFAAGVGVKEVVEFVLKFPKKARPNRRHPCDKTPWHVSIPGKTL